MAAENRKVLLVIDNCPAHSKTDRHLKATELFYLPPNATCKLQLCDQGVIQNLKVHFRKLLLTKVIRHTDAADFQITLLDALSDLKLAWDMVTASTIKNCFRTACFAVDEEASRKTPSGQREEQPSTSSSAPGAADYPLSGGNTELLSRLLKEWNISLSEYFSVDKNIVTSGPEKTATCTGPSPSATVTSQDCDSDHDDCGEVEETVTRKEVRKHVHKTNIYLMQTEGQNAVMKAFYHFKEALDRHIARLSTQTKITQFFSKPGAERKLESQVKSEEDQGEKFHKKQDQPSAEQTQSERKRERERERERRTIVKQRWHLRRVQRRRMESRRKLNRQEIMKRMKRRIRDRHKGNTEERSGKQEWGEMEGERATGNEESREGGKTGEERQHEDTEHLQDIGKGQRESGFAEMTEEKREETKANQPQELLSKEDLDSSIRVARCKDYRWHYWHSCPLSSGDRELTSYSSFKHWKRHNWHWRSFLAPRWCSSFLACPYLRRWKLFTQVRVSDGIWDAGSLRRNADTDCIGTRNSHGHVPGQWFPPTWSPCRRWSSKTVCHVLGTVSGPSAHTSSYQTHPQQRNWTDLKTGKLYGHVANTCTGQCVQMQSLFNLPQGLVASRSDVTWIDGCVSGRRRQMNLPQYPHWLSCGPQSRQAANTRSVASESLCGLCASLVSFLYACVMNLSCDMVYMIQ